MGPCQASNDRHLQYVGPEPLTKEGAVQLMKNNWTQGNEIKIAAWNAQLEQEQAEQAKQERVANEAEEAQCTQQEKEAAEEQRAIEWKKPKLNAFNPNCSVPNWIEPRPSPYTLNKIELRQFQQIYKPRLLRFHSSRRCLCPQAAGCPGIFQEHQERWGPILGRDVRS